MASWNNGTKSATPSYTDGVLHASTYTNDNKTSATAAATAGQYYGFGAFTYSGGQHMAYAATPWNNATEH